MCYILNQLSGLILQTVYPGLGMPPLIYINFLSKEKTA